MLPELRYLPSTILVGIRKKMSLLEDRTSSLWQSFMPFHKSIPRRIGSELYSLQQYPVDYFDSFQVEKEFEKWAAVAVEEVSAIPDHMETMTIPEGWYVVFQYKGPGGDPGIFKYIFNQWLPSSEYRLDQRPHFEILGEKYKNGHPDSEEEIWIPIVNKN
jgi:AraC family transcriptional regulator